MWDWNIDTDSMSKTLLIFAWKDKNLNCEIETIRYLDRQIVQNTWKDKNLNCEIETQKAMRVVSMLHLTWKDKNLNCEIETLITHQHLQNPY